ncbi:MAG: hypothetical protein II599_06065 [Bacteroidales bacterium]|nr:hypothetical protein [Bacteroidales bacterium]MBQ4169379.1 hypothetical protein [Bacteroidales bacterium]
MKVRHIILAAMVLSLSWTVKAQESIPANEAFDFLGFPRSVALSGMAGAGSAMTSSPAALSAFGNPAVLPVSVGKVDAGIIYSHTRSNNVGGGVAVRLGKGFAISAAVVDQLHPMTDFGGSYGSFAPNDLIVAGGAGISFAGHFSLGLSVKYVQQKLMADYSLSSVALTAMAQYRLAGLNVAAGVANFGAAVKSESGQESPLPASARLAVSYELALGPGTLGAAVDGDYYFAGKFGVSAGIQYGLWNMIYARAGYRYASQGAVYPSHLAVGLGFSWKWLCLDVYYLTANAQIGNSLGAGLSIRF